MNVVIPAETRVEILTIGGRKATRQRMEYLFELYPDMKAATHQEIADVIGVERETVSRCMKKLDLGGSLRKQAPRGMLPSMGAGKGGK